MKTGNIKKQNITITNIHWILQTDVFEENLSKLIDVIIKYDDSFELVKYVPFSKTGLHWPLSKVNYNVPTVFYGSLNLAVKINCTTLNPGVICDLPRMKCSSYYPYYGTYLFNDDYLMLPFGEVDRLRDKIFDRFGVNDDVFMRPDSGFKTFSGGLLNRKESLNHFLANNVVFPEEIVVITQPKQIENEWRLVVIDREVVASSRYHHNGLLDTEQGCPSRVLSFAKEVINSTTMQPDNAFVLDIGESCDKIGVMECNSFSCSGFYDCDVEAIVRKMRVLASKIYNNET